MLLVSIFIPPEPETPPSAQPHGQDPRGLGLEHRGCRETTPHRARRVAPVKNTWPTGQANPLAFSSTNLQAGVTTVLDNGPLRSPDPLLHLHLHHLTPRRETAPPSASSTSASLTPASRRLGAGPHHHHTEPPTHHPPQPCSSHDIPLIGHYKQIL